MICRCTSAPPKTAVRGALLQNKASGSMLSCHLLRGPKVKTLKTHTVTKDLGFWTMPRKRKT